MDNEPYRHRVHYYETDKMAVVHHSNYIRFFEEARVDYLRRNGLDFAGVEESCGIMFPVLDVNCKYVKSAKFNDELLIYARLTEFTGVRFVISYDIRFASDGSLCASGTTTLGIINSDYRPISIRHKFPDVYEKFMSLLEAGTCS